MMTIRLETNAIPLSIDLSPTDERLLANGEHIRWDVYRTQIKAQCEIAKSNPEASDLMLRRIDDLIAWSNGK